MYAPPYLQKYKGISTRHTCPQCGKKQSFTLYFDGNTHQPINNKVGKCNRESKCGYHYTPKQFFIDNPMSQSSSMSYKNAHQLQIQHAPSPLERAGVRSLSPPLGGGRVGSIPFSYVERSASYQSNFVRFLCEFLTTEQISSIGEKYAIGATKNKEVVYWQIDIKGKVRTGKIMQYNPFTGKRIKHESGAIDWVHNKLKKSGTLPEDYNLQQCFFGEHLLGLHPEAVVCIVESEKSALISAAIFPEQIWLATGGIGNLSIEKCQVLKGRNIILYPDLNGYNKWLDKAIEIEKQCSCNISISTLLEDIATPGAKAQGLDVADYMIYQLKTPLSQYSQKVKFLSPNGESTRRGIEVRGIGGENTTQVQSHYTPELKSMISRNKSLKQLIDKLELVEI